MIATLAQSKPLIRKLGTIDCDLVETTPLVYQGRLYRFEYVRPDYKPNQTGDTYFRFVDVETGEVTPGFAVGFHLGSAYATEDTVYAYGVTRWGRPDVYVFWSKDLITWSSQLALTTPGWGIYNTSVCLANGRYIMAFEVGEPTEIVGVRFTNFFAESDDLRHWRLLPLECVYIKERYSACPALRFLEDYFYMIYLEARPGPTYESHMVRSRDLVHWEGSQFNPVLQFSLEDKLIQNPQLTADERARIANAVNINNSDVDLCEFKGQTILYYSWGNQQGVEHLAQAAYNGTLAQFLRGFFPA